MALYEVETNAHFLIAWVEDEAAARVMVEETYPADDVIRVTRRPRDSWVISKSVLGIQDQDQAPCDIARECLSEAAGDKVHAIRLYMQKTGNDLNQARKVVESNVVMGW
jgi:hypothetical protein